MLQELSPWMLRDAYWLTSYKGNYCSLLVRCSKKSRALWKVTDKKACHPSTWPHDLTLHVSHHTDNCKERWEVLPHSPYRPDLTPSDYHLFSIFNDHKIGQHYKNNAILGNMHS
jgi:hypothetical protein